MLQIIPETIPPLVPVVAELSAAKSPHVQMMGFVKDSGIEIRDGEGNET